MKATTAKEVLIATKWILQHTSWCQGLSGKDKDGAPVDPGNPKCVSRCLTGALSVVECESALLSKAHILLSNESGAHIRSAISFNDAPGRTKQEVLDLLDRTIARAS
jgi:hypothetical protein